jgi:hypothetical protein
MMKPRVDRPGSLRCRVQAVRFDAGFMMLPPEFSMGVGARYLTPCASFLSDCSTRIFGDRGAACGRVDVDTAEDVPDSGALRNCD